jgi:hypothetical protein
MQKYEEENAYIFLNNALKHTNRKSALNKIQVSRMRKTWRHQERIWVIQLSKNSDFIIMPTVPIVMTGAGLFESQEGFPHEAGAAAAASLFLEEIKNNL